MTWEYLPRTAIFIEGKKARAREIDWSESANQITILKNKAGENIGLTKQYQYDQLTAEKLKNKHKMLITETGKETKDHPSIEWCTNASWQHSVQMQNSIPFHISMIALAINIYSQLLQKSVLRLDMIESRATDWQINGNIGDPAPHVVFCKFDIEKVHKFLDENYSTLIASGKTVDDPIYVLCDGYFVVGYHTSIKCKKDM